jgi:hypothetical protein
MRHVAMFLVQVVVAMLLIAFFAVVTPALILAL